MLMKNKIIAFTIFGCIGITAEIFFTAFYNNAVSMMEAQYFNWSLKGESYVWMFFIYGLASVLLPIFMEKIMKMPLKGRLLIYATGIFIVEFITGFLLDKITGSCPWEYKTGWHIMGYIRLDFLPAWMLFGYLLEQVYLWCKKIGVL